MRARLLVLLAFGFGLLAQALAWRQLAPAARCYVQAGKCVFQYSQSTSPYFDRDLVFAEVGLLVGVLVGAAFARRWWLAGPLKQAGLAALAALASFAAAKLGAWGTEVMPLDAHTAVDRLELRSVVLVLAWPLAQQLVITAHGWQQTKSVLESEDFRQFGS